MTRETKEEEEEEKEEKILHTFLQNLHES